MTRILALATSMWHAIKGPKIIKKEKRWKEMKAGSFEKGETNHNHL